MTGEALHEWIGIGMTVEREINEDPIDPAEYILHNDEGVDLIQYPS